MRGARITVACDCGDVGYVAYGERWGCPKCGRTCNTAQIPADEYWGIMHEMRRFRIQAILVAIAIGGGFALLFATTGRRAVSLVPIVFGGWFLFYMPRWRRKVRSRARTLPTWQLRPD